MWDEDRLSEKISRIVKEDFKPSEEYENEDNDRFAAQYYKEYMLKQPLTLEEDGVQDPLVLRASVHDSTIIDLKEKLLKALTTRKQKVLPLAIQIFNKVQDKHLSTKRIGEYQKSKNPD